MEENGGGGFYTGVSETAEGDVFHGSEVGEAVAFQRRVVDAIERYH